MIYDNTIGTISAIYDGYELNTSPNKVLGVDYYDAPKVNYSKYQLAHSDGEIVTGTKWGEKIIVVEGRTTGTSKAVLEQNLDTLKSKFSNYGKNLDLVIAGATRRYTASLTETTFTIFDCTSTWKLTFTCSAIGKNTSTTSLTFGTYTASNTSYANTFVGTTSLYPTIDITVNSVAPYWENKYIDFNNAVLSKRMRITREWNYDDRVVINGENRTVSLYPSSKTLIDSCDSITGWTSGDTLSLETSNIKEGDGALKIVMAGTGTTSYLERLNSTAIDLSSTMGKIIVPVYIPTPTSGTVGFMRFITGSDATFGSNYSYWNATTQSDGSAITYDAWNYFTVDLSTSPSGTVGTPDRTAIKSIQVSLRDVSAMQLNGWIVDYISLVKPSIIPVALDYEGTFPEFKPGSGTLIVTDELDARNITITGNYTKRYI